MKVLVFGAAGIVGRATFAEAERRGWTVTGLSRGACDVTDAAAVATAVAAARPDLVINCAAFTRVDLCESEPEASRLANGVAPGLLAEACARSGARLVHLSTDYVFDGTARRPYLEDDPTGPRSVYGATKLEGERRALAVDGSLVVRTSWIFGAGGPNFVDTMRARMAPGAEPLRVVDDQTGAPTWAPFLARALADLGESGAAGIVHYQNRDTVTWYGFAREIARQLGTTVEIRPVTTAEVPRPAPRPAWSVLDVERFERLAGRRVEDWRAGLAEHLNTSGER